MKDWPMASNIQNWSNYDNAQFYENKLTTKKLKDFSSLGGLDEGSDVNLIMPYLNTATSVLEVGAGYGRVVDLLIKRGFKGKISAIERSGTFVKILNKKFKRKITLYHNTILNFESNDKFDVILWLWSGISDFCKPEQLSTIKCLSSYLKPNGRFFIDTLVHSKNPANAIDGDNQTDNQTYLIEIESQKVYGYMPSPKEMKEYAKSTGFQNIEYCEYKTKTGRLRNLHTFSALEKQKA